MSKPFKADFVIYFVSFAKLFCIFSWLQKVANGIRLGVVALDPHVAA